MLSDEDLVRGTLAGQSAAFDALVDRYRNPDCGIAYHYLGSFDDSQDAAQDAFVHAYLRLKQLRDPGKFGPWLRRITVNVCADWLRRRGPAPLSLDAIDKDSVGCTSGGARPDECLDRLVVRQALDALPEQARLTLTLFYVSGYSLAETAGFLEIPVNTVRSRLQSAKKRLRKEMLAMVNDVMHEARPGPQFTRQVVEEALRRGDEALQAQERDGAVRCYDEALVALEAMAASADQQQLRMDALWKKSEVVPTVGLHERIWLKEQAVSIARQIGDERTRAEKLIGLAHHVQQPAQAVDYYREALQLYETLDDRQRQAECLQWLGCQSLAAKDVTAGRRYSERAVPLLQAMGAQEYAAVCQALLGLLEDVGDACFPELLAWSALCEVLELKDSVVTRICQPGFCVATEAVPAAFQFSSVFHEVSHLRKLLDPGVPVGGGWSGDVPSFSYQPLRGTLTVISDAERVSTPAGSFEGCLLTQEVTVETHQTDSAPEIMRTLNRDHRCGTRRAWYAPGVGLVQVRVETATGKEALIQLREYSVRDEGISCLPLADGNTWTYGWPGVEPGHVARARYRVACHAGDRWYLENYSCIVARSRCEE